MKIFSSKAAINIYTSSNVAACQTGWKRYIILSRERGSMYTWWGGGPAAHGPSADISPAGAEDWVGAWGHQRPDNAPPSGAAVRGSSAPAHTGGSAGRPHTHSLNSTWKHVCTNKLWSDLSMWWFMNSHCCISIAWDITSETRLKNQINKNLMCQQAQSNRSHVHPHLMWELLNSLQQTPGNFEDSISPVQDVLIYIPLQNTFHCMLPLFGTWQHSINGRPQRAHLRQTKYLCELLEK